MSTTSSRPKQQPVRWTPQIERQAQENMRRTQSILNCGVQIRQIRQDQQEQQRQTHTTRRLSGLWTKIQDIEFHRTTLQSAQRLSAAQATFQYFGSRSLWYNLSQQDRWKRETLLLVLNNVDDFVPEICEQAWLETFMRPSEQEDGTTRHDLGELYDHRETILFDPEILLARSRRPDFRCHDAVSIRFFVEPFVKDKAFLVQFIRNYPKVIEYDILSEDDLADMQIFKAFCSAGETHKFDHDWLQASIQKFDPHLLENAQLVLFALNHRLDIFGSLSAQLLDDRDFALSIAKQSVLSMHKGCFGFFSKRLRSDRQVVLAFCKVDGSSLQFVTSQRLAGDNEIVQAACENHVEALVHCGPCRMRDILTRDKKFILSVFEQCRETGHFDKDLWKLVDSTTLLLDDTNVMAAALSSFCYCCEQTPDVRDPEIHKWLPTGPLSNFQVWLKAFQVQCSERLWRILPGSFQKDATFIWKLVQSNVSLQLYMVRSILDDHPDINNDRRFWLKLDCGAAFAHLPRHLKNDKDVVLRGCSLQPMPFLMTLTGLPILEDRDVVESILRSDPIVWKVLPNSSLSLYPDLVAKAIPQSKENPKHLLDALPNDVLVNRDVALAWCRLYRQLPSTLPPQDWQIYFGYLEEPDFMLQVVGYNLYWLRHASKHLCHNYEFIQKAIDEDPRVFCWASKSLKNDFQLQLKAFSKGVDLAPRFTSLSYTCNDPDAGYRLVAKFARRVRAMLQEYNTIENIMTNAMNEPLTCHCHLSLLNQGPETTRCYKRIVLEYLVGHDIGNDELEQLRQASANLVLWGF